MAVFASAGHNTKGIKVDPGAIGYKGYREADLTIDFRNMIIPLLKNRNLHVIIDQDDETLGQYLKRAKSGSGSVVIEFHFDASRNEQASGCTSVIGSDADRLDKAFAKELVDATARILGIKNRGVISEADTHRGRLGLMREEGTVALLEICFITNPGDIKAYQEKKAELANTIADIIERYENMTA